MIYLTGDIHGTHSITRLNSKNFPEGKTLSRSDYVIICGDFGLIWHNTEEEIFWRNWLEHMPWTTLWIDGNHENFDLLDQYPEEDWNGGKVQKISENVLHLCRGYVFNIDGLRVFAFGGAESHDKEMRRIGLSIWTQEMPTEAEMRRGADSLEKTGWDVDLVLTHTLPTNIQNNIFQNYEYPENDLTNYLCEVDSCLDYKMWFSGHYHLSMNYDGKHFLIFESIVKLTDDGFVTVFPVEEEISEENIPDIVDIEF